MTGVEEQLTFFGHGIVAESDRNTSQWVSKRMSDRADHGTVNTA